MVFGITCPRCDGKKGEECHLCMGRGDQWIFRCPASQVGPEGMALVRAYGAFQNGILPDPGGLYEQSACFVHAMGVLSAEKAAVEKLETRGK